MTEPAVLPAKRVVPGKPVTSIEVHCIDTERATELLFGLTTRLGRAWRRFFRLSHDDEADSFLLNLRVAALLHDLGKANEGFVAAITKGAEQSVRHEHLSALVLCLPAVRSWLASNPALDPDVVTAAVLSHHFKAAEKGHWQWARSTYRQRVTHYLDHPESKRLLSRVMEVAGLERPPPMPQDVWEEAKDGIWTDALLAGRRQARLLARSLRAAEGRRRLTLAVKAGLIIADAVSSAVARENLPMEKWVLDYAHPTPLSPADLDDAILKPYAEEIRRRKGSFAVRKFQSEIAKEGPRAVLVAGCGSGKTLAAWQWARARIAKMEIGRLVFLYPTRGTSTEGFRDYVAWAPANEAALVHGTAAYELVSMRDNPSEATSGKDFGPAEREARLFALNLWPRRYFSATADQFLAFLEHHYKSSCLLPILADAAVIIDEVHSFDRHMFASLLSFLESFDVPVLAMTASLSRPRREQLQSKGLQLYPTASHVELLADLERDESHERYVVELAGDRAPLLAQARDAHAQGFRVLWVANRVDACQQIADELETLIDEPVHSYHSRFRLQDRQRIHRETVDIFKQKERPAIAVTTQVCEMSLDLDADVLITELAPIASLVQRMGRANRHLARGIDFRARVVIYEADKALPYTKDDLDTARQMTATLCGHPVTQRDLADAMEQFGQGEAQVEESSRFVESGYYATPGSFRDTEEISAACLLDTDVPAVLDLIKVRKPYDGFVLSAPRRFVSFKDDRDRRLPSYLGTVPAASYTANRGFRAG
jgi:CRISPR-associated endonuclease/helicase Cas3